jgi:hypothetical protein
MTPAEEKKLLRKFRKIIVNTKKMTAEAKEMIADIERIKKRKIRQVV